MPALDLGFGIWDFGFRILIWYESDLKLIGIWIVDSKPYAIYSRPYTLHLQFSTP